MKNKNKNLESQINDTPSNDIQSNDNRLTEEIANQNNHNTLSSIMELRETYLNDLKKIDEFLQKLEQEKRSAEIKLEQLKGAIFSLDQVISLLNKQS